MRNLGAEVLFHDETSRRRTSERSSWNGKGIRVLPCCQRPLDRGGHGTIGLEMLEDVPDLEVLVVPVGAGGLISGVALAAKTMNPGIEVIGVRGEELRALLPVTPGGPSGGGGVGAYVCGGAGVPESYPA